MKVIISNAAPPGAHDTGCHCCGGAGSLNGGASPCLVCNGSGQCPCSGGR